RRLFYVALTRAEKRAFLSFASTRFRYGNMNYCEPSRFLSEIDASLVESPSIQKTVQKRELSSKNYTLQKHVVKRKLVKSTSAGNTLTESEMAKLSIGTKVKHERFGSGEIVGLEGDFPNKKATVDFKGIGKKQLLLKFAKLQLIE
ncbi:ATP-dependent DNA helicase, partial [Salibacteraceae bacterium]|nr:ATP-dependent DNA helicase [Salibacteraceae bacterium]